MIKLSEKQAKEIRKFKPKPRVKAAYVAGKYGINVSHVYRIWNAVCWK